MTDTLRRALRRRAWRSGSTTCRRERLRTGNLGRADPRQARRRRHHQPDDLPEGDQPSGDAYDEQLARPGAARRRRRRGGARDHHLRRPLGLRRAAAGLRRHRRRRRPGVDRGRPAAGPRHRHAPSPRPRRCGGWSTGRTCSSRSRPPRRGPARRSPQCLAEGISVNVTLIFSLERYGEVMDAFLDGMEQARANGHDLAAHRLGGVVLRLPRRHRDRQAAGQDRHATRPRRCEGKAAIANARLAYQRYEEVFGTDRWTALAAAGAQAAAAAVGLDRRQGPGVRRHACTSSSWSRPAWSTRCPRRPSTRSPTTARSAATPSAAHYAEAAAGAGRSSPRSASTTTTSCRLLEDEGVEKFEDVAGTSCSSRRPTELEAGRPAESGRMTERPVAGRPTERWRQRRSPSGAAPARSAERRRRAERLASPKDPTLWGPEAEPEAAIRLGWLDLPRAVRALLPQLRAAARASSRPTASTTSCSPAWAAPRSRPR